MDNIKKSLPQRCRNPFPNSDSNKRYYTEDYYLRQTYGGKCVKVPLDAGFTCPNIDGKCGYGGCIYCSSRGSGDFAALAALSLKEQYMSTRDSLSGKWVYDRYIPYLQAHTNTYAEKSVLHRTYEELSSLPGAVAVSIATRADCLDGSVMEELAFVAEKMPLTVELGLQTVSDRTAKILNRGHDFNTFTVGYEKLRRELPKVRIAVHMINGLPGEGEEDMILSFRTLGHLYPDEVKMHLLYVVDGTPLAALYRDNKYDPLSKEDYIRITARELCLLPETTVIGRLTGDGDRTKLLAPLWSRDKKSVLNGIDKYLADKEWYQGKDFELSR